MKKCMYLLLPLLLFSMPAEGQILKKLKKQVNQKVEGAVVKNVSEKAEKETDKTLNNMWETNLQNAAFPLGAEQADISEVRDVYEFDWEYSLNMKTEEGAMDMVYLLKEGAPYLGMKMPQAPNMFMVMDHEKSMTVMYMSSGEDKFISAAKVDPASQEMLDKDQETYEDMEIEEIANKTILGFDCKGYRTETDEHILTFYITEEAGIDFQSIYQADRKNAPKGFNPDWLKKGSGLLMEMQMEDKKDASKNMTMTCTELQKKAVHISKSEYQAMAGK